ncbi:hypothetical protein DQM11_09065 [Leuconostoc pseudomesenteroides]|nr:hypothetical protein DQM11_09065 [Leuconostoc pseudomesenteroides]
MIYIFDKKQAIIKVLTNDDFTAAHLNFKINTATTFEFSLPASKVLPSGSKYVATPHPLNDSKFIMLRLTERVDNTETIDYSAYELAYQELATDGYIEDKRPQNQSALNLMKIALNGSNWELNNVNVSGTATTNFYYVDRLSAISKVVDLLGGEIVFYIEIQGNAISGRYMDYLARQGADTSKVFASGSNLLTVERQSDTSNIYTAILPRGKGKEIDNGDADTPDGYGRRINIADVEWKRSAGKPLDKPKGSIVLSDPDATAEWGQINGNARLLLQTYDDIDDVNVLINSAYKTLQSVNHPQIQYSAMVADVGGLSLGDTVLIMHGDRDLSYKTRVFEVKYDLLAPDQTELSLGDDLSSNSITSQINNLNAVANTTSSQTQWTINQIGRPGTTYGETAPDSPKVGDIWFKYLADGGTEIYRWNGNIWELLASPTTADDIATAVTDAVSQANAHTDEVKQVLSSDIATAKSQAASQANAAEANAKSAATSQFNQAQSALSAAKADLTNGIASEASARNAAVAAANSQAQTYANQAKADALNTIAKEVTDRQNAVSALDTKATNAVNQAKSDITDTINAISVGGRNLLLGTAKGFTGIGLNQPNVILGSRYYLTGGKTVSDIYNQYGSSGYLTISFDWIANGSTISGTFNPIWNNNPWSGLAKSSISPSSANLSGHYEYTVKLDRQGYSTGIANSIQFRQDNLQGNITISNLKLESGNKATDWTPAPEDVVLDYTTKDNQIKETITQYQTTNDGKVTKAQTDATTALGQVATKVSQTDYDQKTGDLSTKYTQVKQTADSQAADIVDIKATATSQASKINSISSDVDGTKQSISDIETTQDSQSDKINQITTDVNGTKQSITDIQTKDGQQDTRMGTIETSVSGVKSDFSSYKTTNDGVVKTAQSTAQTAVDGLKTKVSQTDYNTKTGQLQTDLTTTTQTANQAKTDIVSIKQKDGDQDARMTQIESDASGVKTTVSDLQTAQGKQSGDISTLQQRADGFDATVTKVNNLAVGGRNYILNSKRVLSSQDPAAQHNESNVWWDTGWVDTSIPISAFSNKVFTISVQLDYDNVTAISTGDRVGIEIVANEVNPNGSKKSRYFGVWKYVKNAESFHGRISATYDMSGVALKSVYTPNHWGQGMYISGITATNVSVSDPKLEMGNVATDHSLAPEDLSSATAKAQLTADQATTALNNYKTDADGRISKAQSDITQTANQVETKVSQTDYDKKTGDLTEAVSKVKITADGINNFVRDSSGNISFDFQTALSKTSIITGSTLATSIQKQTATQISSALTDNNGKIISLINQDSSGVQIAGKNIVLNGDTTVTGAFKVSQANIDNGAIGTAQIGDAAITSAKIADLDVSKITGDVTNFIKSNWNNAYGSNVTIDGTGMVVSYGNTSTSFENGNVLFKQLADYADGSNQVETIGSISTTHGGTVNNIVIGLYDQTHIPFGSTDGKKIGSPTGEIYGGDLIAFGKARDFNGNFDHIFSYSNQTASLYYGITEGFNFRDKINFNSNEIVSGSVNYNLKIGALKFSGKFDGKYVPVIVATWSGYIGGGIAFGNDNVVAFNQTQSKIIS